ATQQEEKKKRDGKRKEKKKKRKFDLFSRQLGCLKKSKASTGGYKINLASPGSAGNAKKKNDPQIEARDTTAAQPT
ncbi:hypothetical protein, partial [Klebsiella pneumoniae]|uniref:hypothetical protein n=1 Tax=Klebsiella pneumoniae TaxID=573 RepID=UPI003A8C0E21